MTQPWASLVAVGENTIETRSWNTSYRGPLTIHAAKGFPADARELCDETPYREALARGGYMAASELPKGALVAVADLVDVIAFNRSSLRDTRARVARGELPQYEADFGDFSAGRFGFVLRDVRRVPQPIPARGMLGLWTLPRAALAALSKQLGTGESRRTFVAGW